MASIAPSAVKANDEPRHDAGPVCGAPARVAVLGGGIGGLATALFLVRAGHRPVIFEAAREAGGLGAQFDHQGVAIDRFYHVMLDSDSELRALIDELGLAGRVVWQTTSMGFHIDGKLYDFDGPLDLLRFTALPLADRLRVGAGALYVTRLRHPAEDLDGIAAGDWLRRIFGSTACERIWDPLLRAKFGDAHGAIPAFWVWSMLNREKNGRPEVKGYLEGGYATLARALAAAVESGGGELRLGSPVVALEEDSAALRVRTATGDEAFAAVVSTLPPPSLARVVNGDLARAVPLPDLAYQGVVNAVVLSRQRLERFYWTVVLEPSFPFQGVVETTHVIPPEWVGGHHLIYLMNYCRAGSPEYERDDSLLRRQAIEGLSRLYPSFHVGQVDDVRVFRAPYVEPLWSLGYSRRRPPVRTMHPRLYVSTTAQAYPRVTAWNTSVALAREAAAAVTTDHPAAGTAALEASI